MRFRRQSNHDLLGAIHLYREKTGETAVEMKKIADFCLSELNWRMPPALSARDRLAKDLSRAAREEMRFDPVLKQKYRVNHPYPTEPDGAQTRLWDDIDKAPRDHMSLSVQLRRRQMLGDGLQLSFDLDHWNRVNPSEAPIEVVLDFTEDIAERKSAPDEQDHAG